MNHFSAVQDYQIFWQFLLFCRQEKEVFLPLCYWSIYLKKVKCISCQMSFATALLLSLILGTDSTCTNESLCRANCNRSVVNPEEFIRFNWNLTQVPSDIPADAFTVNLVGNSITHISAGAFSNLYKCHQLFLVYNKIMLLTPAAFNGLPKLKVLLLRYNKISVIKANSFAELSSLERLDLGHNSLSVITNGIFFGLKQLRHLHLKYNNIWTIEQGSFAQLHSLMFISIGNNKLVMLDPQTFISLSQPFFMASFCPSTIDLHSLCRLEHEVKHETIYIAPNDCYLKLIRIFFRTDHCEYKGTLFWLAFALSSMLC